MNETKTIEEHRQFWIKIAKENGWYIEPFFIQVWVDTDDTITDSVSYQGITQDIVIQE